MKRNQVESLFLSYHSVTILTVLFSLIACTTSLKQNSINNSSAEINETTSQFEYGIDSIIISEDAGPSSESSLLIETLNSTTPLISETTDSSTENNTETETQETESDYDATEGYTEPTWETSSLNSDKEIYDVKERLNLLESRMRLLEDVNIVWWNNFREMGAPLPKKAI